MLSIPKSHYIKYKVRGQKRKLLRLENHLNDLSNSFPNDSYVNDRYYHYHFPCGEGLVDSTKSSSRIRKISLQLLIDSAKNLTKTRPDSKKDHKIVCAINLPFIWDSQVIVFFDKNYYDNFFNRNSSDQKWTELGTEKSIIKTLNLKCPTGFNEKGFLEEINDEEYKFKGQVWFIGEL